MAKKSFLPGVANVLKRLEALGVLFVVEGENVKARSDGPMPEEAKKIVLENKDLLKSQVLAREKKLQDSLKAIMHQLEKVPAVYARSAAIGEQVAFVRDGYKGVKPGVTVVYTLSELRGLLDMPSKEWEFMHLSKKTFGGGRIVSKEG